MNGNASHVTIAHMDFLTGTFSESKRGCFTQQTFSGFTLEKLLHHAIRDCQKNCEKHIEFFASH